MLETTRNDFFSPWNVEPVFGPLASLWNDIVDEVAADAFERMTDGGVNGRFAIRYVLWKATFELRVSHYVVC